MGGERNPRLPIACQQSWPDTQLQLDVEFSIEYRDGQSVLNVGAYHSDMLVRG